MLLTVKNLPAYKMMCLIYLQQSKNEKLFERAIECGNTLINRTLLNTPEKLIQIASIAPNKEITEICETEKPDAEILLTATDKLRELKPNEPGVPEVNLKYALRVGLNIFQRHLDFLSKAERGKKKRPTKALFSNEIIIFTDLHDATLADKDVDKLSATFSELKLHFYIFTSTIQYPIHVNTKKKDIRQILNRESFFLPEWCNLQKLITNTNSWIANINHASNLFECFKPKKPAFPWNVDLRIGNHIKIKVVGRRITQPFVQPKFVTKEKDDTSQKRQKTQYCWKPAKYEVKIENKAVEIDANEIKAHKPSTEKCFDLLFMMDKTEINQVHCFSKPITKIRPNAKDKRSVRAFNMLYQAMVKQDAVAIVRRCYFKNVYPKMFALVPQTDKKTFIIFQLPFQDDVEAPLDYITGKTGLWRAPTADDLDKISCPEEYDELGDFLKRLTVEDDNFDTLPVHLKYNPQLDFIHNTIIKKIKKSEMNVLSDCDFSFMNLGNLRPPSVQDNVGELSDGELFQALFQVDENQ